MNTFYINLTTYPSLVVVVCCCMWTSPWANSQDWIVRGLLHNCTNEINPNSSTLENVVIWNRAFLFRKFTLSETDPSFFADWRPKTWNKIQQQINNKTNPLGFRLSGDDAKGGRGYGLGWGWGYTHNTERLTHTLMQVTARRCLLNISRGTTGSDYWV